MTTKSREPRILIDDLPAEHLGELEFLWDQRDSMMRSGDHLGSHLVSIERRLEANACGLEVAPRIALPLLEEAVAGPETSLAAAAAWALLRIGGERALQAVLGVLESGEPPAREGVRQALLSGPATEILGRVRKLASSADPAVGVTVAEVLAAHGASDGARALPAWLADPAAAVRLGACRLASWTASGAADLEGVARADADAGVREAAFEAGLWLRAPWVMALGRERARAPGHADPGLLVLFCAIAEPADAPLIAALAADAALGPARWRAVAAYGSKASIEAALTGLGAKDAADAESAGRAFARMTGLELGAAKRVNLAAPTDGGPDAAEFADEAFVPDPELAKRRWEARRQQFETGKRWNRGCDVDRGGASALTSADLAARAECMLRARFRGTATPSRRELLLLP